MRSYFSVIPAAVLLPLLSLVGCASTSDGATPATGKATSAIIKGTDSDETQDAVIRLVWVSGTTGEIASCTGTLLAPNLVLTARHCVARTDEGAACKPDGTPVGAGKVYENRKATDLWVFTGKDRPKFESGKITPAAKGSAIIDDGAKTLCSHDVALVVLGTPIENAKIAAVRLDGPPTVGEEFTAVGWGVTDKTQDPDVRQQRDLTVDVVGPSTALVGISDVEFEVGEGICSGDSGGPAVSKATGAVIGVVSRGGNGQSGQQNPAAGCIGSETRNIFSFPAGFKDLIMKGFEAAEAEPWIEGSPDPRLAKGGASCTDAAACRSASCLTVGSAKVCAPVDCKTEACPTDYECKANDAGKNVCEAKPPAENASSSSSCSVTPASQSGGDMGGRSAFASLFGLGLALVGLGRKRARSQERN